MAPNTATTKAASRRAALLGETAIPSTPPPNRPAPSHESLTVGIPEACNMLSIGRTKLHEMMASGEVRAVRIAGRTLVDVASLRALVAAAPVWKGAAS